jgi:excisionase family DNA binding protein
MYEVDCWGAEVTRTRPLNGHPVALSLQDACDRLGISKRTGQLLIAEGRFPVPKLPSLGLRKHRFSSADLDEYLLTASTGAGR